MPDLVNNPVVQNFGQDCYSEGYEVGYSRSTADRRMRIAKQTRIADKKFKKILGFIDTLKD